MIFDTEIALRLLLAGLAGGLIGFERAQVHKPAGLRTHMLVAFGAALFTIVGLENWSSEGARVMAGIITGIGFLGAGTIFRDKDHVEGLTTAASLWATAGVGVVAGLGEYFILAIAAAFILVILQLYRFHLPKK